MKIHSLKNRVLVLWGTFIAALVILLFTYSAIMVRQVYRDYQSGSQSVADTYADHLGSGISSLNEAVQAIYTSNTYFQRLSWQSSDDFEWIGNCSNLVSAMDIQAASMPDTGGLFLYEGDRNCIWTSFHGVSKGTIAYGTMTEGLKATMAGRLSERHASDVVLLNGQYWYITYYNVRKKSVGYVLNLGDLLFTEEGTEALVTDGEKVWTIFGESEYEAGEILRESNRKGDFLKSVSGKSVVSAPVRNSELTLLLVKEMPSLLKRLTQAGFLAITAVLFLASVFLAFFSYRTMKNILVEPVNHIVRRIESLKSDTHEEWVRDEKIEEYAVINEQIDVLLLEIEKLNEARFIEENRTKEALLQYYQLQINPHFFLNCLNSINSLIESQADEAAKQMIMALSSHFRYVFQSSRKLVTVDEEINETKGYCTIHSMKGGQPILVTAEVDPGLGTLKLPILALQTFAENSIKHVTKNGKVLFVHVHVGEQTEEGKEPLLKVEYFDNGPGYSEEQLAELNAEVIDYEFKSTQVGIDNLKYRLSLLYGGRSSIYFYNVSRGGAGVTILIPEE